MEDESRFLTVKEVSERLNLLPATIYQMVSGKEIPFYKFGGSLRFKLSEIEEWGKVNGK